MEGGEGEKKKGRRRAGQRSRGRREEEKDLFSNNLI